MLKKVHVFGWYNKKNCGDEAYKIAFPTLFPNYKFYFSDINKPLASDTCIVGGGDIFNDSYVKKALKAKKRFIISTGVNSLSPINQIPKFDKVVVRDKDAYEEIKHFPNTLYMPDVALSLQPNKANGEMLLKTAFQKYGLDLYQRRIAIIFNAYLLPNINSLNRDFLTFHNVVADLVKLCDNTPASFVFIPMSVGMPFDDRVANGVIANQCKFWKKNWYITNPLNVQQTLDLVSTCDLAISTRLHSTIFSLISNVPFLDITHHDKNRRYISSLKLDNLSYSYWNFDFADFRDKVNFILDNPDEFKSKIKVAYDAQKEILMNTVKQISLA